MTNDNADDPTRSMPPQGPSPYDQPSPWSTPPAGPSSAPPGSGPDAPPPPDGQQYGGPPPQYGQQPHGQQPYAAQPYGYGPSSEATQVRSSATLWLILNIAGVILWGWLLGGLLGIVGAIFAGLALGQAQTDTPGAARRVRLAKIFFWVGLGLAIAVVVLAVIGLAALRDGRYGGNL